MRTCQLTAAECLEQLLAVCETNAPSALSEVFTRIRSLRVTLDKADALLPAAAAEHCFWRTMLCGCRCNHRCCPRLDDAEMHTRELKFWRLQLNFLSGMQKRVESRLGESIGEDQERFLHRLLTPMRDLVRIAGDAALGSTMFSPPSPEVARLASRPAACGRC